MVKRIIVTVLMVCLVIGTIHAQRARDHIQQGREHLAAQRFEQAIASFEAALRLEPRNRDAPALLRLAQEGRIGQLITQADALVRENKFAEAITAYDSAIRIAPQGFDTSQIRTSRDRANTSLRAQQQQEQQAREQREREAQAVREQREREAQAVREQQELERQQRELERLQEEQLAKLIAERSVQAMENGTVLFIAGQFAEAITQYENAVSTGGLNQTQTTEAQRLLTEAKELQSLRESYTNRRLGNDDFDIAQIAGGISITNYKAVENKTVRIDGQNHSFSFGVLDVVIPERIHNHPVTRIGTDAFANKGITSVVIPNTVTIIWPGAFRNNKLTRVTLGRGVTQIIGRIGGSNELIGSFENNPTLTSIVIPDSVTEIGPMSFANCGLTTVTLGRGVTLIGNRAFMGNALTAITLPASLKTISVLAFSENQIQSVNIPNGVERIYAGAFLDNPLTSLVIPASLATLDGRSQRIGGTTWSVYNYDDMGWDARGDLLLVFPNTLTRITLPANMVNDNMSSFEQGLRNFYSGENRRAGVYVKSGPVWSRQ